jgi:hypothetical protein
MINLRRYIAIDYIYNIVDLEEFRILNHDVFYRWQELGFTQDLNMEDATILSNAFEQMAKYLLGYQETTKVDRGDIELLWGSKRVAKHDETFEMCVFPIIRRTYSKYHVILKPEDYEKIWNAHFNSLYRVYLERQQRVSWKIDVEAEATALLCQLIGKRYKNNIRKIKKKNERHKN